MKSLLVVITLGFGLLAALILAGPLVSDPAPRSVDLVDVSEGMADLAERVLRGTVHLDVRSQDGGEGVRGRSRGFGTGFVIDAVRGLVVTNQHVARAMDSSINVRLNDGRVTSGDVVAVDEKTDIAVVRIPPGFARHQLNWGDSDDLRPGNLVLTVGNPYEHQGTTSLGVISGRERDDVELPNGGFRDFLQIDAFIDHGSSGGPLVDMHGQVVGVNTAIYGQTWQGIGYAVPSQMALRVVADLIEFGRARRGWLGIEGLSVTAQSAEGHDLDRPYGVEVRNLVAGGPAENGKILKNDVILEVNGREISSMENLRARIASFSPSETVRLKVWRDGVPLTLKVILGEVEP
ncbi:MAG TPA: trypsin-like peptidase domain-containing protein [Planctomycetota bacterium]